MSSIATLTNNETVLGDIEREGTGILCIVMVIDCQESVQDY